MRSTNAIAVASVLALVLASCGGAETVSTTTATTSTSTTSPSTTTTAGSSTTTTSAPASGPIVIAESAHEIGVQISGQPTPFSLNPFVAAGWSLPGDLDPLLFGGTWMPGPDGEPLPDLVEALPHPSDGTAAVNPDGSLTLTFHIRPEARWDDGTPVTSADFALTLQILQDPEITVVSGMRDLHVGLAGFEQISDSEFTVTMAPPLTMYRQLFPVVVPAHVVDPATFAEDWTETLWPSAGPMRLVSFERFAAPLAGTVLLEPNPEHRAAPVESLRFDFYQFDDRGDSRAIEAFLEGEADLLGSHAFTSWEVDRIAATASIASSPAVIWEVLLVQPGAKRLESNPDSRVDEVGVRYTIAAALLAASDDLPGERITSLVEYFLPGVENPHGGWDGPWSLLLQPTDVVPLVYESTAGDVTMQIGRALEPLLEEAGFDVELRFEGDSQAAFTRFGEGDFETFAMRLVRLPGATALYDLLDAFGGDQEWLPDVWPDLASRLAYQDALDAFSAELDPVLRIDHLIAAEQALVEAMVVIPLVTRNGEQWAYHPDRVVGPGDFDGQGGIFQNIAAWRRP